MRDRSRAFDEILDVCNRRGEPLGDDGVEHVRAALARPEITFMVARDKSGRPLAYAAAVIDDTVCLIFGTVAFGHEARWALHDYLVRTLIGRRVRYLLAEGGAPFGALNVGTTVQHYQHVLGYELRHLIPVEPQNTGRRRWIVAPVVVTAVTAATLFVAPAAASPGP